MSLEKGADAISAEKFTCRGCLRLVTFIGDEEKFQCLQCPEIQICKSCFKDSYHNHHKLIMKKNPKSPWQPALTSRTAHPFKDLDGNQLDVDTHANTTLHSHLQDKENIAPDDYDILLQMDSKMNNGGMNCKNDNDDTKQIQQAHHHGLASYLAIALKEQADGGPQCGGRSSKLKVGDGRCCVCEQVDEDRVVKLANCKHAIHVECAENLFTEGKNRCQICRAFLLEGLEMASNPKYRPKNGTRPKSGMLYARRGSACRRESSELSKAQSKTEILEKQQMTQNQNSASHSQFILDPQVLNSVNSQSSKLKQMKPSLPPKSNRQFHKFQANKPPKHASITSKSSMGQLPTASTSCLPPIQGAKVAENQQTFQNEALRNIQMNQQQQLKTNNHITLGDFLNANSKLVSTRPQPEVIKYKYVNAYKQKQSLKRSNSSFGNIENAAKQQVGTPMSPVGNSFAIGLLQPNKTTQRFNEIPAMNPKSVRIGLQQNQAGSISSNHDPFQNQPVHKVKRDLIQRFSLDHTNALEANGGKTAIIVPSQTRENFNRKRLSQRNSINGGRFALGRGSSSFGRQAATRSTSKGRSLNTSLAAPMQAKATFDGQQQGHKLLLVQSKKLHY